MLTKIENYIYIHDDNCILSAKSEQGLNKEMEQ